MEADYEEAFEDLQETKERERQERLAWEEEYNRKIARAWKKSLEVEDE